MKTRKSTGKGVDDCPLFPIGVQFVPTSRKESNLFAQKMNIEPGISNREWWRRVFRRVRRGKDIEKYFGETGRAALNDDFTWLHDFDRKVRTIEDVRKLLIAVIEGEEKRCPMGEWFSLEEVKEKRVNALTRLFMEKVYEILYESGVTTPEEEEEAYDRLLGCDVIDDERIMKMAEWAFKTRVEEILELTKTESAVH